MSDVDNPHEGTSDAPFQCYESSMRADELGEEDEKMVEADMELALVDSEEKEWKRQPNYEVMKTKEGLHQKEDHSEVDERKPNEKVGQQQKQEVDQSEEPEEEPHEKDWQQKAQP